MSKLLWMVCFGLCCWISASQTNYEISCRFQGIFHVQKDIRYNQTSEDARKTCLELGAVIATKELVEIALEAEFEICRYGWVDNNTVVIPRRTPNPVCAANYVGLFVLQANVTARYDVFCYNASDMSEKNCEPYTYRNTSVQSHDPTEEGVDNDSGSSTVSPTDPGLDLNSTSLEQGTLLEDVTADPEMSTEQEHSGDHTTPTEDGDIKGYDLFDGDNGQYSTTNPDDLILVDKDDETHIHQEDGNTQATDQSSNWNSGTKHEEVQTNEPYPGDDKEEDATVAISTYPEGSKGSTHTKQKRMAAVPDWLIACVSLVCLALIFSVCIALNARRMCGQKKKLIINGNKGHPEDGVIMEQNGDTVKSQEMVQLVSKDQTDDFDQKEPMTQEEICNEKDVQMKIKV